MSLILVLAGSDSSWQRRIPALASAAHTFRILTDPAAFLQSARITEPTAVVVAAPIPTPADLDMLRSLSLAQPRIPILLATTSQLSAESAMRCARAGATHVFTEPCSDAEVLERLDTAIQEDLAPPPSPKDQPTPRRQAPIKPLRQVIQEHVTQTLSACRGNRTRAAKLLGIDRSTLRRRLEEFEAQAPTRT